MSNTKRFNEYSATKKYETPDPNINLIGNATNDKINMSNPDKNSASFMNQYLKNLNAPFNSISPRFNYAKEAFQKMEIPGPGSYSTNPTKLSMQFENSASFRASSRDKYSLLRNIMNNSSKSPGPGSHNSNISTVVRKTFNTNLK